MRVAEEPGEESQVQTHGHNRGLVRRTLQKIQHQGETCPVGAGTIAWKDRGGCGKLKFCGRCYAKGEKVKKALLLVRPEMPCSPSLTVSHCFRILILELKHKVLWLGRGELNDKVMTLLMFKLTFQDHCNFCGFQCFYTKAQMEAISNAGS